MNIFIYQTSCKNILHYDSVNIIYIINNISFIYIIILMYYVLHNLMHEIGVYVFEQTRL